MEMGELSGGGQHNSVQSCFARPIRKILDDGIARQSDDATTFGWDLKRELADELPACSYVYRKMLFKAFEAGIEDA